MLAWLLVHFMLCSCTRAQTATSVPTFCPEGYQDGGNNFCYKPFLNALNVTRDVASKPCNFDGGRLPSITNAFASTNSMRAIWTGLICQTADKTSCQFDGALTTLNSTSYLNFAKGFPDSSHGPFVILNPANGLWQTTGYDHLAYICEVPKGNPTLGCSQGYDIFKNNCYKYVEPNNATINEAACSQDGAHLDSIHSIQENNFTTSYADNKNNWISSYPYYRIGLNSNPSNQMSWIDGSKYDYNNFGLENNKYGSCVAVSLIRDTVFAGQWISSSCDKEFPAVCKKATEARYNPYFPPSVSSRSCSRYTALNGGGTFYSPNYPGAYSGDSASKNCAYVLTATRDVVTVSFPEMNLESDSSISLYNDVTDTEPFAKLTYTSGLGKTYTSTGPAMKVVFQASYVNYDYGSWMAFYY